MEYDSDKFFDVLTSLSDAYSKFEPEVIYAEFLHSANFFDDPIVNVNGGYININDCYTKYNSIILEYNEILDSIKNLLDKANDFAVSISETNIDFLNLYLNYITGDDSISSFNELENNDIKDDYFKEYIIDYFLRNGNDGSLIYNLFIKLYPDYLKCSYSGEFSGMTDWQNVKLTSAITQFSNLGIKYGYLVRGKSVDEILEILAEKGDVDLYKSFLILKAYGYGDFVFEEEMRDTESNSDFSGAVLSDKSGEFYMGFDCTKMNASDVSYDVALFLKYYAESSGNEDLINFLNTLNNEDKKILAKRLDSVAKAFGMSDGMKDAFLTVQYSDDNYRELAEKYTQKYIEGAKVNGSKIYVGGYSLGGSLAEYSTIYILNNEPDVLGELTVMNGLNADLEKEDFDRLKSLGHDKCHVYINEGDVVSQYVHPDAFNNFAIYLKQDWKSIYDEAKGKIKNKEPLFKLRDTDKEKLKLILGDDAQSVLNFLDKDVNYAKLLVSGACHSNYQALKSSSFGIYGNVYINDFVNDYDYNITEGNGVVIDGIPGSKVTFSEVSEYVFGYNVMNMLDSTFNSHQGKNLIKLMDGAAKGKMDPSNSFANLDNFREDPLLMADIVAQSDLIKNGIPAAYEHYVTNNTKSLRSDAWKYYEETEGVEAIPAALGYAGTVVVDDAAKIGGKVVEYGADVLDGIAEKASDIADLFS